MRALLGTATVVAITVAATLLTVVTISRINQFGGDFMIEVFREIIFAWISLAGVIGYLWARSSRPSG